MVWLKVSEVAALVGKTKRMIRINIKNGVV